MKKSTLTNTSVNFMFRRECRIIITLLVGFVISFNTVSAQSPIIITTDSSLSISNNIIYRKFKVPKNVGPFYTVDYKPVAGDFRYLTNECREFYFEIDGKEYSGKSSWQRKTISQVRDDNGGNGVSIILIDVNNEVQVTVDYFTYDTLPVIRKKLTIKNLKEVLVPLESVDVENFSVTEYAPLTFSWIMSDYGRRKNLAPYKGTRQDALVIVHNPDWAEGIVIGNESPGVLKKTNVFLHTEEIRSGLTDKDDDYPFRKWLKPGESFEAPQVFTLVYNGAKNSDSILNGPVADFVRKNLGARLFQMDSKPLFLYNTWNPFQKNINEELIYQLANAAAAAGMKEFIIDDGWQSNYGDWDVDTVKFPKGLKPVFDYIKKLGMKPGLWISMGTAEPQSRVFKEHEDWFIEGKDGAFASQSAWQPDRSACLSTEWYEYIRNKIVTLIREHGLQYLKLDFAVAASAYRVNPKKSGCYAKNHRGHKDHSESLWSNYAMLWKLIDDIHKENDNLFIDCTFEAMGGMQMVDYAMLKHAEGNWLSNFEEPREKGALRIRNMAWWRSPAIPATALVIGNAEMDDLDYRLFLQSLIGSLPMMLGDPRKLDENQNQVYKSYSDWLGRMENLYAVMAFRQDLAGFGEPMEGHWDGFQRINTETKSGGIFGVFRHGAAESERKIVLTGLADEKKYVVKDDAGHHIGVFTGKSLRKEGLKLKIEGLYEGRLFEVGVRP